MADVIKDLSVALNLMMGVLRKKRKIWQRHRREGLVRTEAETGVMLNKHRNTESYKGEGTVPPRASAGSLALLTP